ncbi:MAG: PaaI family thioesterase [Planctomycetota bacterium]
MRDDTSNEKELQGLFDGAPVNRLLGLRLVETGCDEARLALAPRGEFVQEGGRVHGGVLTTLADSSAVYALLPGLPDGKSMTSVEFKLNFLRPVQIGGADIEAHARVVQRGRRVALCDVELSQGGKALAKGLFTYLIFEEG